MAKDGHLNFEANEFSFESSSDVFGCISKAISFNLNEMNTVEHVTLLDMDSNQKAIREIRSSWKMDNAPSSVYDVYRAQDQSVSDRQQTDTSGMQYAATTGHTNRIERAEATFPQRWPSWNMDNAPSSVYDVYRAQDQSVSDRQQTDTSGMQYAATTGHTNRIERAEATFPQRWPSWNMDNAPSSVYDVYRVQDQSVSDRQQTDTSGMQYAATTGHTNRIERAEPTFPQRWPSWNMDNAPSSVYDVYRVQDQSVSDRQQTDTSGMQYAATEHILRNIDSKRRSCDDSKMTVQTSSCSKQLKRFCCYYCKKTYTKLARHLEYVHKDETEVRRFASLPKEGSKERQNILDELRKKGNYEWNMDEKLNKGILITCRRPNPNKPTEARYFTSCMNCLGSYKKTSISHHVKNCTNKLLKGDRSTLVLGRSVEGRIHVNACEHLKNIFDTFKVDDVVLSIRYDFLIMVYGNKLTSKFKKLKHYGMIRSKLRRAGQLLLEMKKNCSDVSDLASIFQPKCYDTFVEAVRKIGKLDPATNYYGAPSTAAATVTETKEIGSYLECEYIKQNNTEKLIQTQNFLKLVKMDAGASIYKAVYDTLAKMHREKKDIIPTTGDVKLLSDFLDRERKLYYNLLSTQEFEYSTWLRLSELTLVSLIVFNRRRVGESQDILSTDFEGRDFLNEEELLHLSDADKILGKEYSLMTIQGKKGRDVPALLKTCIEKCLHLLMSLRKEAKIPNENEFLFALPPTAAKPIRNMNACNIVRKFSIECQAKNPSSLRGTTLRKHMASVCIWKDLDDNTVSEVADFMGHEEKIHRLHYRRNPKVRQIVKMSKLLEAARGNVDESNTQDSTSSALPESVKPSAGANSATTNKKRNQDVAKSEVQYNGTESERSRKIPKVMALRRKQNKVLTKTGPHVKGKESQRKVKRNGGCRKN